MGKTTPKQSKALIWRGSTHCSTSATTTLPLRMSAILSRRATHSRGALVRSTKDAGNRLKTAFPDEALPDRRDMRFAIFERGRRRVDRVVAEGEIVLVRRGRAENELSVGQGLELDRFARGLESHEVAVPQLVRRRQNA